MGTGEVSADNKLLAFVKSALHPRTASFARLVPTVLPLCNNTLEAKALDGGEHFWRRGFLVFDDMNPRRGEFQRVQDPPAFFNRQTHHVATVVHEKIEYEVVNAGRCTTVVLEKIKLRLSRIIKGHYFAINNRVVRQIR